MSRNGSFRSLLDKGDTRMLKVLVRYVAVRLNEIGYHDDGDKGWRSRTDLRGQLLSLLYDLPLRNEVSFKILHIYFYFA